MTLNPNVSTVADVLPALTDTVARHKTLLGFDFDGTLAPLVDDPSQARMTEAAASALKELAALPAVADGRLVLALVSGRDLDTLHSLSEAPAGTYLIASHGAQRGLVAKDGSLTRQESLHLSDADAERLAQLGDAVGGVVDAHPGTMLESKPLAVVLHTRGCESEVADSADQATLMVAHEFRVPVLRGHDVIEMPVVHATKGKAVADLKEELGLGAVIFAGDDVTDETVIEDLAPTHGDIGIKVGKAETAAQYRVADPEAIGQLMTGLSESLTG